MTAIFTILLLLNNPEKLRLVVEELDKAFPSIKDDVITFANTMDLSYLNAAINESMRLMPIVATGMYSYSTYAGGNKPPQKAQEGKYSD